MTYTTKLENWLPEQTRMKNIWKLLQYDPYAPLATTDDTFISALRENIAYHYRQNDFYRDLLNARGFSPEQPQTINDLSAVPFIHADFFKQHVVTTASQEQVVMQATSSGTTGQKSQHFFHIPLENIRDKYESVEHPISYIECEHQHLHIPTYERVLVRDVKTLQPLPYGDIGFAQLISPVITSMPSHSILMGDLFSLHPAGSCACGRQTPWVVVEGRAGGAFTKLLTNRPGMVTTLARDRITL